MGREVLDLSRALSDSGLQLESVDEAGNPIVRDLQQPDSPPQKMNLMQLMSDQQMDPANVDVQYNTQDTPIGENAIGFKTGVKLAWAKTNIDRMKILEEEFDADNVQVNDAGEISIKQGGVWKRADASFISQLASDGGVMAAGMAGSALGAKKGVVAGALLGGPVGAGIGGVIGGVLGGAVGATVGRFSTNELAEAVGIRTESDAKEVQDELGKEFTNALIWDVALMGTAKVTKPLIKGAGGFARRGLEMVTNKRIIAETGEKLIAGTKRFDWETVLRSNDDAKAVLKEMDIFTRWDTKRAAGEASSLLDPVTRKSVALTTGFMKRAKTAAMRDFDQGMQHLEKHGALRGSVDISLTFDNLRATLKEAGVLSMEGAAPLTTNQALKQKQFVGIFDNASRRQLQVIFKQLENLKKGSANLHTRVTGTKPVDRLSIRDARKHLQAIDGILENSGVWKNGELAITSEARRLLKETRAALRQDIGRGLAKIDIPSIRDSRTKVNAATIYNDINTTYSKFRNVFDDFDITKSLDKGEYNTVKTRQTIDRMLGDAGADLENRFSALADITGQDGRAALRRLQQLRAAKNLSKTYAPSQTGLGTVISRTALGITGPSEGAKLAAGLGRVIDGTKNTPVSQATLSTIKRVGEATQFIKGLPIIGRLELMNNPEMYRGFINTIQGQGELEDQMVNDLLQGSGL